MKETLEVNYNWLATRQGELNQVITQNHIENPDKKDIEKYEQNLMNYGAMQMISEIIEKFQTK